MVRLGFFTGKIYDSSINPSTITECCIMLNYKEPVDENEELVIRKRKELKARCEGCYGCPEAQAAFLKGGVACSN